MRTPYFRRRYRRARGPRTLFFGDSITIGQTVLASNQHRAFSHATNCWQMSNGQLRYMPFGNAGVSGDDSGEMLARIDAAVLAKNPDIVIILCGANDALSGLSIATTRANMISIVGKIAAIGATPVVCLPPLTETKTAEIAAIHVVMRDVAALYNVPLVDTYSPVMNAAQSAWIGGYSYDQTHPTRYGSAVIAETIITTLRRLGVLWPKRPYLTQSASDPLNLITNGTFEGDTNGDGMANSWSGTPTTGRVMSLIADPKIIGNWQQVEVTQSSVIMAGNQSIAAAGKFSAGDRIAFSGLFRTEHVGAPGDVSATYCRPNLLVEQSGGSTVEGSGTFYLFDQFGYDLPYGRQFYGETIVPANTTSLNFRITSTSTGTGKIALAQVTAVNLTTHPELDSAYGLAA